MISLYQMTFLFNSKGSSQSGVGNSNSIYCGGFLNDFPEATTDAKIRGNLTEWLLVLSIYRLFSDFLIIYFFSDCTTPFQVSVVTDATADAIAATIASSNKGKINL